MSCCEIFMFLKELEKWHHWSDSGFFSVLGVFCQRSWKKNNFCFILVFSYCCLLRKLMHRKEVGLAVNWSHLLNNPTLKNWMVLQSSLNFSKHLLERECWLLIQCNTWLARKANNSKMHCSLYSFFPFSSPMGEILRPMK